MKFGGLQRVSLIDYPGRISAVLFTQGCNFRCPYCHNPELVDPARYDEAIPEADVLSFLDRRIGKLDAVVLSGGEPTLQPDLLSFAREVRARGYAVKVDTNGSRPEVLKRLIEAGLVDHVAMDVKAPLEKYRIVTRSDVEQDAIRQSIECIIASAVRHEFRTTAVKSLLREGDLARIVRLIRPSRNFVLQNFVPSRTLDAGYREETPFSQEELEALRRGIEKEVSCVLIR